MNATIREVIHAEEHNEDDVGQAGEEQQLQQQQ